MKNLICIFVFLLFFQNLYSDELAHDPTVLYKGGDFPYREYINDYEPLVYNGISSWVLTNLEYPVENNWTYLMELDNQCKAYYFHKILLTSAISTEWIDSDSLNKITNRLYETYFYGSNWGSNEYQNYIDKGIEVTYGPINWMKVYEDLKKILPELE